MSVQPTHIDPKPAATPSAEGEPNLRLVHPAPEPAAGKTGDPALASAVSALVAKCLTDKPMSMSILAGAVRALDFAAVFALGALTFWIYVPDPEADRALYFSVALLAAVVNTMYVHSSGGYTLPGILPYARTVRRVLAAWSAVFATLAVVVFFMKIGTDLSRVWLALWFLSGAAFLAFERAVLASVARRWIRMGRLARRAVIVGGGQAAADLIQSLEAQPDNDIRICGVFDDRKDSRSPAVVAGYPRLGTIDELVEFGRVGKIDMLIVTLPLTAEARVLQLLKKLWVLPVDIRLSAHASKLKFRPRSYSYVGSVPLFDVVDKPLADWDRVMKRAFDLTFGLLALLALMPIMVGAAIAIKLDSRGPIFFRQKRYGFNNELIDVWKFRSMYVDQADADAARLVTRGDPRVTRVGRFIRRTSIDELPQLFNVIAGTLSLVGPRPHALSAKADNQLYEQVVDSYFARHRVKPGVTGWAQINGWRGETDTSDKIERRVECDLYYIENWSIAFDLYILFATPLRLLSSENAY